jgi:hypothetical protein
MHKKTRQEEREKEREREIEGGSEVCACVGNRSSGKDVLLKDDNRVQIAYPRNDIGVSRVKEPT